MKKISINEKEYVLEYSFEAVEHQSVLQELFDAMFGSHMLCDVSVLISDVPHIVKYAFYAGLMENQEISEEEAYQLMKRYLKENKCSFNQLLEVITQCMEDDGFFQSSEKEPYIEERLSESNRISSQNENKEVMKKIDVNGLIWKAYLPNALAVGVPYEVFWHLNPKKLESFYDAYKIKQKMRDEEAWANNIYTLRAFQVVMAQFGAGLSGKRSTAQYFEKPLMGEVSRQRELTEEEKQREVDKFFARENARRVNWKRNKIREG